MVSFNVGSRSRTTDKTELGIKPLNVFQQQIDTMTEPASLAVHGSGAAAVEIALACRSRFPKTDIVLIARNGLLRRNSSALQTVVKRELHSYRIDLIDHQNVDAPPFECIIHATGPQAHPWQAQSELETNKAGYFLIKPSLQCVSHDYVFAVGDCSSMLNTHYDKSGVHAVRQAPILGHNLAQRLFGQEQLKPYQPQQRALYLLASNNKTAFGAYGNLTIQGRCVYFPYYDTDIIRV